MRIAALILASFYLFLTACGFRPVYGENAQLAGVKIGQIHFREVRQEEAKYELKRALSLQFASKNSPKYILDADVTAEEVAVNVQTDSSSYRMKMNIKASIVLRGMMSDKVIYRDRIYVSESYELAGSPLSGRIAKEKTSRDLMNNLATEIKFRILDVIKEEE